jgi:hypothetical protein
MAEVNDFTQLAEGVTGRLLIEAADFLQGTQQMAVRLTPGSSTVANKTWRRTKNM